MSGRLPQDPHWIDEFIAAPRDDLIGPDQRKIGIIEFAGLL